MPSEPKRILILGGTTEARLLAERLSGDDRYFPLTSLAGLTRETEEIEGESRSGGFGGVEGLATFIAEREIALVVDAAHPFAAQISANAVAACQRVDVPCLRLERSRWEAQGGDEWTHVDDVAAAAEAIPADARAFVTVGRQEVDAFFSREDVLVLARMIEPLSEQPPSHVEIVLSRPPFTLTQELTLMQAKGISVLVTKNSGGEATFAKIAAARALSLPVIMVARPDKPPAITVATVDEVMGLIADVIG